MNASLPTRVQAAALPVIAALKVAREELAGATTPEAVEDVRTKLAAFRAFCAAALRDPNVSAEDVAAAKREADELALEAAVKLGSMVPVDVADGRPAKPTAAVGFSTVAEVAKRCGVPASTLRDYRNLAAAFAARADDFMSIAREAINRGAAVPMGRLIELVKPKPPKGDKPNPPAPTPPPPRPNPPPPARDDRPPTPAQREAQADTARTLGVIQEAKGKDDPFADEIPTMGADCKKVCDLLSEAVAVWTAIVPHPLPPTVTSDGRKHPPPRDVRLAQVHSVFITGVEALAESVREVASMDLDAVIDLRAQRDRAKGKKRGA